jgi:adenosylhomocysteine nucleosidase
MKPLKHWVVLISAEAEWQAVREHFPRQPRRISPFGEIIHVQENDQKIIFFQGGWGKIAAASTQYVIDHYKPAGIANLGTCGGIKGKVEQGEILLVEETLVYDIYEQMGDPQAAIQDYAVCLDLSWLPQSPIPVRRAKLLSADRDILPSDVPQLTQEYQAIAADWETGAIAWVAQRNAMRCLILRVVTDLVSVGSGDIYGDYPAFVQEARAAMHKLLDSFPLWISA